ncbi:MAG: hypothetical protein ACPHO4_15450, partial [Longimicrobiales bacterium]
MRACTSVRARMIALGALAALLAACDQGPTHSIVPVPQQIVMGDGSFTLDPDVTVHFDDPSDDGARSVFDVWAAPYR